MFPCQKVKCIQIFWNLFPNYAIQRALYISKCQSIKAHSYNCRISIIYHFKNFLKNVSELHNFEKETLTTNYNSFQKLFPLPLHLSMKRSIFMQFQKLHSGMSEEELMKIEGESTKLETKSIGGMDLLL